MFRGNGVRLCSLNEGCAVASRVERCFNVAELRKLAKGSMPAPVFHYIDSVRRSTHILKALALGARACSAGRPRLNGLGAGGEAYVRRAATILKTERARMGLHGTPVVRDRDASFIRKVGASWV